MENQRQVWDREYGRRGTAWSRQTRLPNILEGKAVLESGVGNGKTLAGILLQNPAHVVSYDFSPAALHKCKTSAEEPTPLLRADATNLPSKDAAYDVVVLYYLLNNMLEADRMSAVKEAHRILKTGGTILFEDFGVGDFRQKTAKRTDEPEENTILKKKGLLCHYFSVDEVNTLFKVFTQIDVKLRQTTHIRNKEHLIRSIISAQITK